MCVYIFPTLILQLLVLSAGSGQDRIDQKLDGECTLENEKCRFSVLSQPMSDNDVVAANLLQLQAVGIPRQLKQPRGFDAATPSERLSRLQPLAWVHMPKGGTSFVNTIYNFPSLCPGVAPGLRVPSAQSYLEPLTHFLEEFPPDELCPGSISHTYTLDWHSRMHIGLSQTLYDENAGHFVTFLRQPEQRIASAYFDNFHDWYGVRPPSDMREFAEGVQGCQVKMLTRSSENAACAGAPLSPRPSRDEIELAVIRLWEGFAFVGLTDQWNLSICLFHAKFGGECKPADFEDMRLSPKRSKTTEMHDLSQLGKFIDTADRELYEEGVRIFERDLERYGVSEEFCSRSCWDVV